MLKHEIRAGPPKTAVGPENAVLIMQARPVTYREIELSLGIWPTNIHSLLHAESPNRSKKDLVDWSIDILEKYDLGASKDIYKIATDDKSWIYAYEPGTKLQSTMWAFDEKSNSTKVVSGKSTSRQM